MPSLLMSQKPGYLIILRLQEAIGEMYNSWGLPGVPESSAGLDPREEYSVKLLGGFGWHKRRCLKMIQRTRQDKCLTETREMRPRSPKQVPVVR